MLSRLMLIRLDQRHFLVSVDRWRVVPYPVQRRATRRDQVLFEELSL